MAIMMTGGHRGRECQLFPKALNNPCIVRWRLQTSGIINMRRSNTFCYR
jgi:hypothetical protein